MPPEHSTARQFGLTPGGKVEHDRKLFTLLEGEMTAAHSAALINLLFKETTQIFALSVCGA